MSSSSIPWQILLLLIVVVGLGPMRELAPSQYATAEHATLLVAGVLPGTPAGEAGLRAGDSITSATLGDRIYKAIDPVAFTEFIASDTNKEPMTLDILRDQKILHITTMPRTGVVPGNPSRVALGISVAAVGVVPTPLWQAPWEAAKLTWQITAETAVGLVHFFYGLVTFSADLSQVSGPIGIAGAVGSASAHGVGALLTLVAVISINLALINFLPVPALDGGRLLFVIIEAVIRRPLPAAASRAVNTIGFGLLILLMLVITAHDVFKIFA